MVESLLGPVPAGWEQATLGDACKRADGDIQTGPFGSQLHASDYVPEGIPSIMPQNIKDNRVMEDGIARISPKDAKRLSRYLVQAGDIVYSRRGDVERRALIRKREDGWLCGTGCLRIRFSASTINPSFAAYYLGHPQVREWIVRHAQGATMPNLNTSILSALPFLIPPRAQQDAIAEILGSLDDKIELNRRMNETMDALVQTIFRAMFLERKHEKTGPLSDLVRASREIIDPQAFPDESFLHYSIPAFDAGRVPASELGFEIKSAKLSVPEGSILFSRLNPREPRVWLPDSCGNGYRPICSTEFFIAIPKAEAREREFIYGLFYSQPFLEAARGRAMGISNSHQRVRPEDVLGIECPVGTTDSRREFSTLVRPLLAQIARNRNEAQVLATTRDAILPKLVSGEIRT